MGSIIPENTDTLIRMAAFNHVRRLGEIHDHLTAAELNPGFVFQPFGEKEQRTCSPVRLKQKFASCPDAEALTDSLNLLTCSIEWQLWSDLRNRMTHRSNLPRLIRGAVGSEPPPAKILEFSATTSTPVFEGDVASLESLFAWLSRPLGSLLIAGRLFVVRC
jgi:hypothetical protein